MSLLTDAEHEAVRLTADVANAMRGVIGEGPNAANDWNEIAYYIHGLQNAILAQAAARAYPDLYRLMGSRGAWHAAESEVAA